MMSPPGLRLLPRLVRLRGRHALRQRLARTGAAGSALDSSLCSSLVLWRRQLGPPQARFFSMNMYDAAGLAYNYTTAGGVTVKSNMTDYLVAPDAGGRALPPHAWARLLPPLLAAAAAQTAVLLAAVAAPAAAPLLALHPSPQKWL